MELKLNENLANCGSRGTVYSYLVGGVIIINFHKIVYGVKYDVKLFSIALIYESALTSIT